MKVRDRLSEGINRERAAIELKRATRPFALLLAGLALTFASFAFILSQLNVPWPWEDPLELNVVVDNAEGVVPGQHDVRVAGVVAGRITAADLARGGARLTVELEDEYAPVYRDARVRLRPQTQLQDMYLDLESRGSQAAGELADGDTIGADRTRTSVHVNRVLDVFQPPTRRRLEQLLDGFSDGLADDGAQLRDAFAQLAPFLRSATRLTRETAVRRRQTRRLVHNARVLFTELGRRDDQLTSLVDKGSAVLGETGSRRDQVATLLQELPPMLARLRSSMGALGGALGHVDPALVALREPTRELEGGLAALDRFSADARPALARLRPAVRTLQPLSRTLPRTSRELASAFKTLRPQAPQLDRVTADVAGCQLAIQKFFQDTISVFKFGDANGTYPRGSLVQHGLATAGQRSPNLIRGKSCARREEGK